MGRVIPSDVFAAVSTDQPPHPPSLCLNERQYTAHLWADPESDVVRRFTRNLTSSVNAFNRTSYWVATEICLTPDLKTRASLIRFFAGVAKVGPPKALVMSNTVCTQKGPGGGGCVWPLFDHFASGLAD